MNEISMEHFLPNRLSRIFQIHFFYSMTHWELYLCKLDIKIIMQGFISSLQDTKVIFLDAPRNIFSRKMQDLKLSCTWENFRTRSDYSSRITNIRIFHWGSRWNNSSWQAPNFNWILPVITKVREKIFRYVPSFARSLLIFCLMVKFKYFLGSSLKKVC